MTTALPIAPVAPDTPPAPIACVLGSGEYADRLAWIADLNRSALRAHRQDGHALMLDYVPHAAPRVRELVAREQTCCAFLAFRVQDVHEAPAAVRLTVEAPAQAREAADALFAPFLAGVERVPVHRAPVERAPSGPADPAVGHPEDRPGDPPPQSRASGIAAGTAAVAAFACGVCCVLPFALPAVVVATLGGVLGAFARVYWWALGGAVAAVIGAWLWVAWQSARTRRRPTRSTLHAMLGATALLGAAVG